MFSDKMAQGSDRWAAKILALPVFSDRFFQGLAPVPICQLDNGSGDGGGLGS